MKYNPIQIKKIRNLKLLRKILLRLNHIFINKNILLLIKVNLRENTESMTIDQPTDFIQLNLLLLIIIFLHKEILRREKVKK